MTGRGSGAGAASAARGPVDGVAPPVPALLGDRSARTGQDGEGHQREQGAHGAQAARGGAVGSQGPHDRLAAYEVS